jgi:uroporphyrinogen decarboxylase
MALSHNTPDRVPVDFAAEPEVWQRLMQHLRLDTREDIMRYLDVDCRVVSYDYNVFCRPPDTSVDSDKLLYNKWHREMPDGTIADIWGARRKTVHNEFGAYRELCNYPLADARSIADLKVYNWPKPDWWDFSQLYRAIRDINQNCEYHLRYRIGSIFETSWSLRGLNQFLMDMALQPEIPCYIMDRLLEVHLENLKRVMDIAGDNIDMIYTYDDIAHQSSLLLSRDMWRNTLKKRQELLFNMAKSYGKPLMYHSCGAIHPLIDELIDMGVDLLSPVQTKASGMGFENLKRGFGDRISFHGGIDIQELLPKRSPKEIKQEAARVVDILGKGGGYILAPAHHIQADTPLENILALYSVSCGEEVN